ncbi:hypothetical protein RIVM261_062720 [Rivularia sp. IAM M-261]|nr:hypothetical protein CAL7716_048900 [Calothrix sp. PCC 7716]GJD21316.1 hypothetical protein RIVM261_062720 [Rivularia sp. IAM M-261]
MRLPKQAHPVKRPDLLIPHEVVDIINGREEDLAKILLDLMHGANFNDPPAYQYRSYNHLKSSRRKN